MSIVNKLKKKLFHHIDERYHRQNVKITRKQVKSFTNVSPLTSKEKKETRKVYRKYHIKPNFKHLALFKACHGYSPYYISDNVYYGKVLTKHNNDQRRKIDDKNYYDLLFNTANMPKTLCRKIKGIYLSKDYNSLSIEECLDIIDKAEDAIFKISIESAGGDSIIFKHNSTREEIVKFMNNHDDFIVQDVIKQHPILAKFNEGSINTFRLMVFHFDGKFEIVSSLIRCGITNSGIDNFSKGGITFAVHPDGTLGNFAVDKYGKKYESHPKNSLVFSQYKLDEDIVKSIYDDTIKQAQKIPFMRISSWDYTIDEEKRPILIECNIWMGGQLDLHQMAQGPIFEKYFPIFLKK